MAADYIRDFLDATKHLKDAAEQLKKASGGKPIGQSLDDAVKGIVRPSSRQLDPKNAADIFSAVSWGDTPGKGTPGPPIPTENKFKQDQYDMIRALASRLDKPEASAKSDPTRSLNKPSAIYRQLRKGATAGMAKAKKSWLGKLGSKALNTKVGRSAGRIAGRVGAVAASRGGMTAATAVAAGTAVTAGAAVTAGVAIVAAALVLFGKVVVAAADKQLDAMRQYEKVSAGMAAVFAVADMRDTFRNMERGEQLAPSAQVLSNADQKLKDNSSEIVILVERIQNNIMGFIEGGLADVLEVVNEAAKAINKWFGDDEKAKLEAFDVFLDRVKADTAKSLQAGDRWHAARR